MSTSPSSYPTSTNATEFKWTHSANWLLINSYLNLIDEFHDPRIRKKDLWMKISDRFRELGYDVPYDLLDKKFRNLKSTYYLINDRKKHSNKEIKWEYYKVFEDILKGKEIAARVISKRVTENGTQADNIRTCIYERKPDQVAGLSSSENVNEGVQLVTIVPADEERDSVTIDDDSNGTRRNERVYELDINVNDVLIDDSHDGAFENGENQSQNGGTTKKVNLSGLQARKLQAETRYFNKKADYFEKQTSCLEIQRKLMIMQAHKLKLEIEQLKAMDDD